MNFYTRTEVNAEITNSPEAIRETKTTNGNAFYSIDILTVIIFLLMKFHAAINESTNSNPI